MRKTALAESGPRPKGGSRKKKKSAHQVIYARPLLAPDEEGRIQICSAPGLPSRKRVPTQKMVSTQALRWVPTQKEGPDPEGRPWPKAGPDPEGAVRFYKKKK